MRNDSEEAVQALVHDDEDPWTQALCGCGWGDLKIRESEVPARCPICNSPITGEYAQE